MVFGETYNFLGKKKTSQIVDAFVLACCVFVPQLTESGSPMWGMQLEVFGDFLGVQFWVPVGLGEVYLPFVW